MGLINTLKTGRIARTIGVAIAALSIYSMPLNAAEKPLHDAITGNAGMTERSFVVNKGLSSGEYVSIDDIIDGVPIPEEVQKKENKKAQESIDNMLGMGRKIPEIRRPLPEAENYSGNITVYSKSNENSQKLRFMKRPFSTEFNNLPANFVLNGKEANDFFESEYLIDIEEHVKLNDDYSKKPFDYTNWFLKIPVNAMATFVGTVVWHELGHARVASYYGWENITMHGPELEKGIVASVSYRLPADVSNKERAQVSAAGVEATSAMSHFLYQSLKTGSIPESLRPLVATTSLMMMLDRHRYLWSSAIKNYGRMDIDCSNDFNSILEKTLADQLPGYYVEYPKITIVDSIPVKSFDIIVYGRNGEPYKLKPYVDPEGNWRKQVDPANYRDTKENREKMQWQKDIAYGVALGASILELGLRFDEIKYLVGTAVGGNPEAPEGYDIIKAGFYPIQNGIFVSIDGSW